MILVRSGKRTRFFTTEFESILNQIWVFKANLKRFPFHHPKCVYRCESSLDIHVPKLSERCVGFEFFEAIGWQRYAAMNGGIVLW